jgi:hypothetical protein
VVVVKDHRLADQRPADVRIEFPSQGHVYELRSGQYLGHTDRVDATLETARGKVFAVLPYQVKGLKLNLAGRAVGGQDLVVRIELAANAPVGTDDRHVIRLQVFRPDAREEVALRRWVVVTGGRGEVPLPIAFDDPVAKWTVRCQDVATGLVKEVSFKVGR